MKLVPTGRKTDVHGTARCDGCHGLLAAPQVLIAHVPCSCAPGGHRTLTCRDCKTIHYEPLHGASAAS